MQAIILAAAMAIAGPAAASPFDGLWVDDLETQMGQAGFDTYFVAKGIYTCESCSPRRTYPADGRLRPVPGDSAGTSEAVAVTERRSIVIRTVSRQMTRVTTMIVAPNGKAATYVSLDSWPRLGRRLRTRYLARRVAPAPPGAHPVSGAWQGVAYLEVPEEYRSVALKEADGRFTRSNFRHGRYTATIGGPPAPVTGDGQDRYTAMVRAPDAHTRVETILLGGRALVERTYRLSADGKSMVTAVRDPSDGHVYSATSHRKRPATP